MKILARVVFGQKIARKFSVPTANLQILQKNFPPKFGVFAVKIIFKKKNFDGILFFGRKKNAKKISAEAHIFNFSREIYGEILEIKIKKFCREIRDFPNFDALFSQIKIDILRAKKFFCRQKIFEKWKNLSPEILKKLEKMAVEKILKNEKFLNSKKIFAFAPTNFEINFSRIFADFPAKKFFFPRIEKNKMEFFAANFCDLKKNKFGILAPKKNLKNLEKNPDFVFVPALAADKNFFRLGRGGGFFDRFLVKNSAPTLAILPDFAVFEKIPVESHDEKIDEILKIGKMVADS